MGMPANLQHRLRRGVAVATAGAVLSLFAPVHAQTSAVEREQARKLAAEGFEALQRKDYAAAEDRFRRADALVHAPTLVVDHARALTGLGRLVEAHERYELVLREGIAPNAPWQWRLAHADAERELEALKPRLAWLTLRVVGPREPVVQVDNRNVPLAALGVRRATDPGTHAVSVSANGYAPKEEIVSLDEGETVALEIELEVDPEAVAKPKPVEETPEAPEAERPPPPERDNTLAYVVLGVGGLGIVAGAVTGALALGARSDLESQCPNGVCRPTSRLELQEHENDVDEYRLWGTLSGVSFAVGLAAAATGMTILLVGSGDDSSGAAPKSKVAAYAGPGEIGVVGAF
jgi:hypothetical protein